MKLTKKLTVSLLSAVIAAGLSSAVYAAPKGFTYYTDVNSLPKSTCDDIKNGTAIVVQALTDCVGSSDFVDGMNKSTFPKDKLVNGFLYKIADINSDNSDTINWKCKTGKYADLGLEKQWGLSEAYFLYNIDNTGTADDDAIWGGFNVKWNNLDHIYVLVDQWDKVCNAVDHSGSHVPVVTHSNGQGGIESTFGYNNYPC